MQVDRGMRSEPLASAAAMPLLKANRTLDVVTMKR